MKQDVIADVYFEGGNYSAGIELLPGCVTVGNSVQEIKKHMEEAVAGHVALSLRDNDPIPEVFATGNYHIVYKLSVEALLQQYSDVFTKEALSKITGINAKQLWHYASGLKKPRPAQIKRIEEGIHNLAKELLEVEL